MLLCSAATGVLGFVIGRQTISAREMRTLSDVALGDLNQRLEVLSLLRTNKMLAAIEHLEQQVDQLILGLAPHVSDRYALAPAKAYRQVVPSSTSNNELEAAFNGVPEARLEHCRTALREFLLASRRDRNSPPR